MKHIPDKVKEIVEEHINMIDTSLPNFLESYYVYGSISLGAFNYGKSDVDFLAVIQREASEIDLVTLQKIHATMHKKYKKTILDGMYLFRDDIFDLEKRKISCLRFNDGELKGINMFDRNSIDALQVKKYGIGIKGQAIETLDYPIDFDILINKMRDNLNSYWLNWVNTCRKFPSSRYILLLFSLKAIEWGVLGVSRLYYTFKEKDIISKVGAGEYALQNVPQKWHRIINESMRLRRANVQSYYHSAFERRNDAIGYIDFIIEECNRLFD